jgi:hypothetical protein
MAPSRYRGIADITRRDHLQPAGVVVLPVGGRLQHRDRAAPCAPARQHVAERLMVALVPAADPEQLPAAVGGHERIDG